MHLLVILQRYYKMLGRTINTKKHLAPITFPEILASLGLRYIGKAYFPSRNCLFVVDLL
jgi:hypothetical protein